MSFQGKKNIYICNHCGHGFVSLDVNDGTTPFMTKCLNCEKMAQSMFYAAPQQMLAETKPAIEWYRPSPLELTTMSQGLRAHVENGGLVSRVVKP